MDPGPSFRRRNRKQNHPRSTFHNPINEEWKKQESINLADPSLRPWAASREENYLHSKSQRSSLRRPMRRPFNDVPTTSSSSGSGEGSSATSGETGSEVTTKNREQSPPEMKRTEDEEPEQEKYVGLEKIFCTDEIGAAWVWK